MRNTSGMNSYVNAAHNIASVTDGTRSVYVEIYDISRIPPGLRFLREVGLHPTDKDLSIPHYSTD